MVTRAAVVIVVVSSKCASCSACAGNGAVLISVLTPCVLQILLPMIGALPSDAGELHRTLPT